MENLQVFNENNKPTNQQKEEIISFLHTHLDEFGDKKEDITKAVNYALRESRSPGGFVLQLTENNKTICTVVVNETGMSGYIPENILVYIATHKSQRGKGVGKKMIKKALEEAKGNVALHVEPNNPAKFLYEKIEFTNKYLEMRYEKNA